MESHPDVSPVRRPFLFYGGGGGGGGRPGVDIVDQVDWLVQESLEKRKKNQC